MTDSPENSKTSDFLGSSSGTDIELQIKPRHLETRILYTDYDTQKQRKMLASAKEAVQAAVEKGLDGDEPFFQEVAALMKESLATASEEDKKKKWNVVAGNDFGIQADAVKGSISFFAVGDVKLVVYRTPNG